MNFRVLGDGFFWEFGDWLDLATKAISARCAECERHVEAGRIRFAEATENIQDRISVPIKGGRHKFLRMCRYHYASHRLADGRLCVNSGLQVPWRFVIDAALEKLRGEETT